MTPRMTQQGQRTMKNEFATTIEKDDDWSIAFYAEIPEANGQGRTMDEALDSLDKAITLVLKDHRK